MSLLTCDQCRRYGITYFEVTNKKGTRLWLGVHNLGMDVYVPRQNEEKRCTVYALTWERTLHREHSASGLKFNGAVCAPTDILEHAGFLQI